ncbi:hypothetical protein LguiA_011361 [Lonicera macranthoides]
MAADRRSWSSLSAESPFSAAAGATFRRDDCIVSRLVTDNVTKSPEQLKTEGI